MSNIIHILSSFILAVSSVPHWEELQCEDGHKYLFSEVRQGRGWAGHRVATINLNRIGEIFNVAVVVVVAVVVDVGGLAAWLRPLT